MRKVRTLLFLIALSSLASCAKTYQARRVETSGFLGDYSQFQEGGEGQALLVYRNPSADFTRYNKVLIEHISIWRPVDSNLYDLPDQDARALARGLHRVLLDELGEDYEPVRSAGPGVLRIRAAITEAAESWVVLDTVTSALPPTRLLGNLTRLATGTNAFVGEAGIEAEIVDGVTGERLLAGVDRRIGSKVLRGSLESWDDVHSSFRFWAKRLKDRLRDERGQRESQDS